MADVFYSSIYGALTQNVQIRFDEVTAQHKKLYDNIIFEKFLDWDEPTIGLTFEEWLGQYHMTIAAATIGDNSFEPIVGREGMEKFAEKVLNHAITIPMTDDDYRKVLSILDSKSLPDKVKTTQLVNSMFKDAKDAVAGVLAKIDLIFLTALSNEGIVTLDENNNPEGGVRGTINYQQPAENIATASTQWTDANIATVDVFEDIQAIAEAASEKVALAKILCAPKIINYICRSKKMKQVIFGTDKSSTPLLLANLNAFLAQNGLPVFEPIRREILIQNHTKRTPLRPWNEKNIVFVPDGKLGLVKNAFANNELKQQPGVAYSNYGRIRVSQWGVGETQDSNGVEFTKAQCRALPVITEMSGIYTLKTQE